MWVSTGSSSARCSAEYAGSHEGTAPGWEREVEGEAERALEAQPALPSAIVTSPAATERRIAPI
jgi:hypothetical protein